MSADPKEPKAGEGYTVAETVDVLDRPSPYAENDRNSQDAPYSDDNGDK